MYFAICGGSSRVIWSAFVQGVIVEMLPDIPHVGKHGYYGIKFLDGLPHASRERWYCGRERSSPAQPRECDDEELEIRPSPEQEFFVLGFAHREAPPLKAGRPHGDVGKAARVRKSRPKRDLRRS